MPDLTIEVAEVCPMWASNFQVPSSDGTNNYLVQTHKNEPASCSCRAYQYSGAYGEQHCKHIDKLFANGCFYHPQSGEKAKAWNEFNFDDNQIVWLEWSNDPTGSACPGCGNAMISVRIAV
jgi:hypothetical protein